MRLAGVRIWYFGDDFHSIVHGEQQYSVVHAIGVLLDAKTAICLYGACGMLYKLANVELAMALRQLVLLVGHETTSREVEKLRSAW
jgi:hypothetical protein